MVVEELSMVCGVYGAQLANASLKLQVKVQLTFGGCTLHILLALVGVAQRLLGGPRGGNNNNT